MAKVRRFCNPKVTLIGRVGHPAPLDRKMVKCAGVSFEDRQEGKRWTLRKYDPYPPDWPAMDIWTVAVLTPVNSRDRARGMAYGPQTPVTVEAVPDEVRDFGIAELVRLRLRNKVWS